MTKEDIAKLLKKARENRGYTQLEIADLLSYTPQNISLWEVSKVSIKIDVFINFCNIVNYDPYEFFKGRLVDLKDKVNFDYKLFVSNLNYLIERRTISKKELIWTLDISYPTLTKILKNELVIYTEQVISLSEYIKIDIKKLLFEKLETNQTYKLESRSQKRVKKLITLSFCLVFTGIVAGLSIYLAINKASITPTSFQEQTPNINIDYYSKSLTGFEVNSNYLINNEDFIPSSTSIIIKKSWYDKKIEIIKKARNENYINSNALKFYINSKRFENYYSDTDYISSALFDEDFESKLNVLSKYDENYDDNYYTLTYSQKQILSDSLNMDLPNLKEYYFNAPLSNYVNNQYQFNYEIKTETVNGNQNTYVEISSVNSSSITKLYIPNTIDSISDIRISDYAFDVSKNPNLVEIIFQEKPTYIGDYAFNGLSLDVLDFGVNDNLNKKTYVKMQPKNSQTNFSNAFYGIKKISKARLPLRFYRSGDSLGYSYSSINYMNLFGETSVIENTNFNGIYSLVLPNPINSETKFFPNEMLTMNCKIYSIYVPNTLVFYFGTSDTKIADLYLRLVRFQDGYSYSTNYELVGKDSTKKTIQMPNSFNHTSFERCYALEYVIFDDQNNGAFLRKNMFNGNLSFRGCINYENIMLIGTNCFQGADLPSKIKLKKVFKINANAFKDSFNLTQVDIYKSDDINSNYPLKIEEGAFSYSSSNLLNKMQKIIFHNFNEDELDLASNYKDSSIQVEFVND